MSQLFTAIGRTYIRLYTSGIDSELAEVIFDTTAYFGRWDKARIDWPASKKLDHLSTLYGLDTSPAASSITSLHDSLADCFQLCDMHDIKFSTTVTKGLVESLTRYAYLLVNIDSNATEHIKGQFYGRCKSIFQQVSMSVRDENMLELSSGDQLFEAIAPVDTTSKAVASRKHIDDHSGNGLNQAIAEISSLVGLAEVKSDISNLINYLRVQQLRRSAGLPVLDIGHHMVFYGNPGTGKTTIARLLGAVYRSLGILSNGHLVEVDRSALVAGYLGKTAIKTKEVLESARGGVLFVDEAYTLAQGAEVDPYGQEAIDTILKYMEDNRSEIVIIVAGYEARMTSFIDSNPGLRSRFSKYFLFPDYTPSELKEIFVGIARQSEYSVSDTLLSRLSLICNDIYEKRGPHFGNGRAMRNLFERCVANQANRLIKDNDLSHQKLMEIKDCDLYARDINAVL